MRILRDEHVPRRLRQQLRDHEVATVINMDWGSLANGELLRLAALDFVVLLTCDRRIQYQQRIHSFDIELVVLLAKRNDRTSFFPLMPRLRSVLEDGPAPGTATRISTLSVA